jgi:chromosome segregation ATPase
MTEFETIVTASPGEENPMMAQAIGFFHMMLDTIANATTLAKEVKELAGEVRQLRAEVEEVHLRNMALTDQINAVRVDRDNFAAETASLRVKQRELEAELEQTKHMLSVTVDEREFHRSRANVAEERAQRHLDSIAQTSGEKEVLVAELSATREKFHGLEEQVRNLVGSLQPLKAAEPQQDMVPEPADFTTVVEPEQEPGQGSTPTILERMAG